MKNKMGGLSLLFALLALCVSVASQEPSQPSTSSAAAPSVDTQGVGTYLLGPGDTLDVRVFGQSDLNTVVEIDGDGNISSLPFLEAPIKAQCKTDKQVQKEITAAYGKYIKNPQVSVRIMERKSRQPATISGAVKTPLQVVMMRRVRLHELITRAGGTTDRANGFVQIMHTEGAMCPEPGEVAPKAPDGNGSFDIAVYSLNEMRMGKEGADPFIWPGDIVQVREGDPVYVIGQVTSPRELVLRDQLTLHRAILMAGGVQSTAKTSEVHIYRLKDGQASPVSLTYNYDAIKKGKAQDVLLQPNDVIEVGKAGGIGPILKDMLRTVPGSVVSRAIIF